MLRRLFGLFTLERRLSQEVANNFQLSHSSLQIQLTAFEKRLAAGSQQLDKLEADINQRLSRLEVLFADELAEKEKIRIQKIKESRSPG